ncbi:MAG TPA: TonB family protein [Steroidobacteraceae bacterium]|nr:TonB family protein [Steroidobacteraceae bacterium]
MPPTNCARTALVVFVLSAVLAPSAYAQTGPLEPRLVIAGQPYPQFEPDIAIDFLAATAELAVDADGKVTEVRIAESSGNERFDQIVRKYYSKFRLIPALSEAGQPIAAQTEVRFRVAIDDPQSGRLRGPEDYVQAEVRRIQRMQCDDFIWEYERMQEIAHGAALDEEYLFQTSFAMVEASQKLTAAETERVAKKSGAVLKETAKHCRKNPAARYFADAYQPAVMKRAGR